MAASKEARFGTDGIRARYGEEPLTPTSILRLGHAIGRVLAAYEQPGRARPAKRVLIGRDTRESGPAILAALARGLQAEGLPLHDLGVIPTPGVAYAVRDLGAVAGMVISASHNPAEDNGIKLFGPDGFKLADHLERAIEEAFDAIDLATLDASRADQVEGAPIQDASEFARNYQLSLIEHGKKSGCDKALAGRKLVIDCANGAASFIAPAVFEALGAEVIAVAASPNGLNINDGCGALHPESLSEHVKQHGADAGVTFDGDADRLMLLDEEGRVFDGDLMLAMLARKLHETGKLAGDVVVGTVMANLGLERSLREIKVKLARVPVGDRYVVAEMLRSNFALGGEQSGHVINMAEGSTTGDGIFSAISLLAWGLRDGQKLGAHYSLVTRVPQVLINLAVTSKPPVEELTTTQAAVKLAENELGDSGRVLLRYSGTEKKLRVMVEGIDEAQINAFAEAIAEAARAEIGA